MIRNFHCNILSKVPIKIVIHECKYLDASSKKLDVYKGAFEGGGKNQSLPGDNCESESSDSFCIMQNYCGPPKRLSSFIKENSIFFQRSSKLSHINLLQSLYDSTLKAARENLECSLTNEDNFFLGGGAHQFYTMQKKIR